MKSYNQPPILIKLALEAACVMLGVTPKVIEVGEGKNMKKEYDYWGKAKKLLNEHKKFLDSLVKYPKDDIPDDRLNKIKEYLENPKFRPEIIRNASEAAEGICKWVIAICKYNDVAVQVKPKIAALDAATEKLKKVTQELKEKENALQELIDKKALLQNKFNQQNLERLSLSTQIQDCQIKLDRALKLTGSLGKERGRWVERAEQLKIEKESLLGDVIVASACISYLGPFPGKQY